MTSPAAKAILLLTQLSGFETAPTAKSIGASYPKLVALLQDAEDAALGKDAITWPVMLRAARAAAAGMQPPPLA